MTRRLGAPRGGSGLAPFGMPQKALRALLYALTNLSSANRFETAVGGGEVGVATGFGGFSEFRLDALPASAVQVLAARAAFGGNTGFILWINNGVLTALVSSQAGALVASPTRTLLASDIGKIHTAMFYFDGAKVRLWFDREQQGDGLGAMSGYTTANVAQSMGALQTTGSYPATGCAILSEMFWRGTPTDAQLRAAFDTTRVDGDLPRTIAGATVTHRHSLKEQLLGITNPAGRRTYGARSYAPTNYMQTPNPGGVAGVDTGFSIGGWVRFDYLAGANGSIVARTNNSNAGWQVAVLATNRFAFYCVNNGGVFVNTFYQLTAADVLSGWRYFECVHTGSALQIWLDGVKVAGDQAITGFTPFAGPTVVGQLLGSQAAVGVSIAALNGGHGVPTPAEITSALLATETNGALTAIPGKKSWAVELTTDVAANGGPNNGVPATVLDRIGTSNLTRSGTLELAVNTETAPPAPAQLTDTITQASVDALARFGSPRVTTIDTSIDGRSTKGVLGFGNEAYLEGTVAPFGSASGLWACWYGVVDTSVAAVRFLCGTRESAVQRGFGLGINASSQPFFELTGSGAPIGVLGTALANADLGQPTIFHGRYTGSAIEVYRDGVLIGTPVAVSGFTAALSKWRVGRMSDSTFAASNVRAFGEAGGNGVPTLAQIQAHAKAVLAAGRMVDMEGLPAGLLHDFTADIAANGGDLPVVFTDRAGTCHLSRQDIDTPKVGPNSVRGVGPYSATDVWRSADGGGIQGSAGGASIIVDLVFTKIPSGVTETFVAACNAAGTQGLYAQVSSTGLVRFGASVTSATYQIVAGDLNKRLRFLCQFTGSVLRLYGPYTATQNGSDVAFTYSAPSSAVPFQVGSFLGSQSLASGWVERVQGGPVVMTGPQITAAFADLTQPAPLVAGQKSYDFNLDTAATPTKTPRTSVERVSGATADTLTRFGAGLQLAQRVEHPWSYETSPIHYGADTFSLTDYLEALLLNAMPGDAVGFTVSLLARPLTQNVASGNRYLFGQRGAANQGFNFAITGTNSSVVFGCGGNTTAVNSPGATIAGADVGKLHLFTGVWDGIAGLARLYSKRAQVGAGSALTGGYAPDTSVAPIIGKRTSGAGIAADGWAIYGVTYSVGIATLSQIQAQWDACMASERIQKLPGLANVLIDLDADVRANGNAFPSSFTDRGGSAVTSFAKVGNPLLNSAYARAWAA